MSNDFGDPNDGPPTPPDLPPISERQWGKLKAATCVSREDAIAFWKECDRPQDIGVARMTVADIEIETYFVLYYE